MSSSRSGIEPCRSTTLPSRPPAGASSSSHSICPPNSRWRKHLPAVRGQSGAADSPSVRTSRPGWPLSIPRALWTLRVDRARHVSPPCTGCRADSAGAPTGTSAGRSEGCTRSLPEPRLCGPRCARCRHAPRSSWLGDHSTVRFRVREGVTAESAYPCFLANCPRRSPDTSSDSRRLIQRVRRMLAGAASAPRIASTLTGDFILPSVGSSSPTRRDDGHGDGVGR